MKPKLLFYGLLLAVAAGCRPKSSALPAGNPAVRTYVAHGIIQRLAPDFHAATIKHDAIAGYMGAMTMDFPVRDTNELVGLAPNDEITFQLVVTTNDDWIEGVRFIAHHLSEATNGVVTFHAETAELKPGDLLPDYTFTGEDGRPLRFSDFRGSAVAFTFFFTSCPLPDFCPRMNKNFFEARRLITTLTHSPANWELLSISFDSDFDKPAVLAAFGNYYRENDTNHWLFAVAAPQTLAGLAPQVDLHFWREAGSISHNLRTVVVDPTGKIFRQFDGNNWTPEELAGALLQAAQKK